jgi:hypothetical protein
MVGYRPKNIGTNRLLTLNARRIAMVLGFFALSAIPFQLMLDASPLVVMVCLLAAAVGLIGFVALGAYNLGSWLILFFTLGNVLVALYAKTLLGQPLDSHLRAPLNSYIAVAVTGIAMLAALVLVRRVRVGRPLFRGESDPRFLGFLSWTCFGLGGIAWLLNRWFQDPSGSGFGGIAIFRDLLLMAVIARTGMLLERTACRKALDWRLGLMVSVSVFLGLVDNSKTMAALPVLSYFVTVLFYRRGLSVRALLVFVLGASLFAGILAPMIHALRALGQHEMSVDQRIDLIISNLHRVVESPEEFDRLAEIAAGRFEHGYYDYFGASGAGQMLLGRYASIQQIDPVVSEVDRQGTYGGAAIWPGFSRLLPSAVHPEKPEHVESFNTLVHFRLIHPDGGKFPTLPLGGQAYAGYGYIGLLFLPVLTFFVFLVVVKKLGWQLHRNVYAIFFFSSFVVVYASQGDFGQYMDASLRRFPLFAAIFWLLAQFYRFRPRRRNLSHWLHSDGQTVVHRPMLASFRVEQERE